MISKILKKTNTILVKLNVNGVQNGLLKPANLISSQSGNDIIREAIYSGRPFAASRLGGVETRIVNINRFNKNKNLYERIINGIKNGVETSYNDARYQASINAGIFSNNDENLDVFANIYSNSIKNLDLMGYWGFIPYEVSLVEGINDNVVFAEPRCLEPYYFKNPWSEALNNKKLLVIHPFKDTIEYQYRNKKMLFKNTEIHMDYSLTVLKSVQSLAGNKVEYTNWQEALYSMQKEVEKIDFDVAIIGAGAYGLPLTSLVKSIGKQAIHMGGATQILFGIKGKRWDKHEVIGDLYNDFWIRPMKSDYIDKFTKVENGCYW